MSFSPLITFVLEEPDETQNGIHTAQGNPNICLGNRGMAFIGFEGGTQRAGSRADHTPSLSEELGWGRSPLGTQGLSVTGQLEREPAVQ